MWGTVRFALISGLLVLGGASAAWAGGSSAAPSAKVGGALAQALPRHLGAARTSAASPVHSQTFAGWLTSQSGAATVSTSFHVPKLNCTADNGFAPAAFIFTGSSDEAAGVLDQCVGGVHYLLPALVVSGVETNFTNKMKNGDLVNVSVSVGAGGTTVSVNDATKGFTDTLTGSDTSATQEFAGLVATSFNGNPVPIPQVGGARLTAAVVNGSAMGSQSPAKVLLTSGCQVLLAPKGFDSTKEVFSVSAPHINVTSVNPTVATAGTNVEIDGLGFTSTTAVKFGGAATATTVTHDSATVMHAVVPKAARTGPITLTNTTAPAGSIASACSFAVAPSITSLNPTSGRTGIPVTIGGSGLQPSAKVTFGTTAAAITSKSATQLKVTVPNGVTTGTITVTTPSGMATVTPFTVTFSITSINPSSGPHGTVVTVNGVGFNSTSAVKFNGLAATTVVHVSSTQLKATVPATATSGPVTVTNTSAPTGTVASHKSYAVTADVAPNVSSFNPTSGGVGTPVTLTGSHFSGASAVKFGTVKAPFKVVSDTEITTTVPSGAVTAPISVTNAIGAGTSPTSFTVT